MTARIATGLAVGMGVVLIFEIGWLCSSLYNSDQRRAAAAQRAAQDCGYCVDAVLECRRAAK